ncbi:MAG: TetR family transcriptional regulator C-terminal domain-containing protein [Ideonella sp.]|nr:TetR family transcriptional regulator C-terminal domain-containing protein [Ideonella sp.]
MVSFDHLVISLAGRRRIAGTIGPVQKPPPRAPQRPREQRRHDKEQAILKEAEAQFARGGFHGTSLEGIAAALGLSRHNLLYYFPSKDALYRRVIDDVVAQWLEGMGAIAASDEPAAALRRYIGAKLRYSAERPEGTSVFTQEVMAGAPRYAREIVERVQPVLQADVRVFERWARGRRVHRLPFTHLMFVLWAATQAYADLAPQFALLLGKPRLDAADFAAAQAVIEALAFGALGLAAPAADEPPRAAAGKRPLAGPKRRR